MTQEAPPLIHPTAQIHPTAYIAPGVMVGARTIIGPYCRIGLPAEYLDYRLAEQGRVLIGTDCVLTGGVCIDSGREGATYIGHRVFIMSNVHIGHDCEVMNDAVLSAGCTLAGFVKIGTQASIGINAALHQYSNVPFRCIIGAGSVLTKKHFSTLEPTQSYAGNPARWIGPNKKWQ
jgi:UDP-N-acetylglucosamine acyltransferase